VSPPTATRGRPCTLVLPELWSKPLADGGHRIATGTASVRLDVRDIRWDEGTGKAHLEYRVSLTGVRYHVEPGATDDEVRAVVNVEKGLREGMEGGG
jgi:hypothetical protein